MTRRPIWILALSLFVVSLGVACDLGSLLGGSASMPTIHIQSPENQSQFSEGEEITVQSIATDASGVVSVDLFVDGELVRSDPATAGQAGAQAEPFATVSQKWQAVAGTHTLGVRARSVAGQLSDLNSITVTIVPAAARLSSPTEGTPIGGGAGRMAFTSERDGNVEIYVMNADGSQQTNLTNNPASDWWAAWSPNGAQIAFQSDRDGRPEIYVMNANGAYQMRLTNHPAGSEKPAWSPDGTRIAFNTKRDGNSEVYVMNADGSQPHNLTNNPADDSEPDWSPDGTRLAFNSDRDGNAEIYVMNADGSHLTRLTDNPASDYTPAWSQDGTRIAFFSNRDGNWEIHVVNADGSQPTRLTHSAATDFRPRWSTDGSLIIFSSKRDGNEQVYVMKSDGSQQMRISNNDKNEYKPVWQPRDAPAEALKTPPASINAQATLWLPSPTVTNTGSLAPTAGVPAATATVKPTVKPAASVTPNTIVQAPSPTVKATAQVPPGLYVTALRTDPAALAERVDAGFYVTFLNTMNAEPSYQWNVFVFRADNPKNSFGEAAPLMETIPVGTTEHRTNGSWRIGVGACGSYFARVASLDNGKNRTYFAGPDGQVFEYYFKVCQ